jgi:hypothetical protein
MIFAVAIVSLVVIPAGDLRLFVPLHVFAVVCSCRCLFLLLFVLAVILSSEGPGTANPTHVARTRSSFKAIPDGNKSSSLSLQQG